MNKRIWGTLAVASLFFDAEGMNRGVRFDVYSPECFINLLEQEIKLKEDKLKEDKLVKVKEFKIDNIKEKDDGNYYLTVLYREKEEEESTKESTKESTEKRKCKKVRKRKKTYGMKTFDMSVGKIEPLKGGKQRLILQGLGICCLLPTTLFEKVTEIKLDESITEVSEGMSFGVVFQNLKRISGEKLAKISVTCAFSDCHSLNYFNFPNLENLSESVFWRCKSLPEVVIPETAQEVGWRCFAECENLRNVIIKSSCVAFGPQVFRKCQELKNISFPPKYNFRKYAYWALLGSPLEGKFETASIDEDGCIKIPEDVRLLEYTLSSISHLRKIEFEQSQQPKEEINIPEAFAILSENLSELSWPLCKKLCINKRAFSCCGLTRIDFSGIPNVQIEERGFAECRKLEEVNFSKNTEIYLGSSAFWSCKKLRRIHLDDNATIVLDCSVFSDTSLTSLYLPEKTTLKERYFIWKVVPNKVQLVEFPKNVFETIDFSILDSFNAIIMVPANEQ